MNNAKSFQPSPINFSIGALVGLALGLLIGWVLWPVEWQGATLRDLDAAGKAEFVAAVADAFVIYDSPEAAAIAQQRLVSLQPNVDAEFAAAIRYFQSSSQAERAIRISNIGRLATSLGMVPPDLQASTADTQAGLTGNDGQTASDTENPNVANATSSGDVGAATGTISWFRWFLWLLAALLLLGGGLYLLDAAGIFDWQRWLAARLASARKRTDVDEFDDFDAEENEHSSSKQPPWRDEKRNTFVSDSEDLAFESDEEEVGPWRYQPTTADTLHGDDWDDDSDDEFSDDDLDDEFNQTQHDGYEHFRPPRDHANPAHFTADSFQRDQLDKRLSAENLDPIVDDKGENQKPNKLGSTTGQHTSLDDGADEFDADGLDDGIVPTIAGVMAAVTNRPSPSAAFMATEDDNNDDVWDDDDLDDDGLDGDGLDGDGLDDDFDDSGLDDDGLTDGEGTDDGGASISRFTKENAEAIQNRVKQASVSPIMPLTRRPETPTQSSGVASAIGQTERNAQQSRATQQPTVPQKQSRHKLIDQHTLHYQMGMSEYDESKPIVDPSSGKYIGEFGMGTSSKNGVVQPNSDHVAALEVWLFDKSDEKNMGNQTRILLSEYAVDHNLEQSFVKERQDNPRPFTPQPGVHFQLESQNLLLDCTIIDVQYLNNGGVKGMFQSIRVDMSVHQRQ